MNKYEISIWEDFSDETSDGKKFLNERKIAVIGSDTMAGQVRAIEPNLVNELNGTNTFTFKMFYTYLDNETGERYDNPFGKYLINERKIKVFWQDKWYDMVIKKCQEDTSKKSVTYTCKDLFINELSKNGYSLEFDTELQNNTGTAEELAKAVLEGSTWQYDEDNSTAIMQRTEGPVYEVNTLVKFNATKQPSDTVTSIPKEVKILVFYDSIVDILSESTSNNIETQFLYSATGYETDINDVLVINGNCYSCVLDYKRNGEYLDAYLNNTRVFQINTAIGVSERYRAKRYVRSRITEYDPVLDRYAYLCKEQNTGKDVYEVATTEYTDPLTIINLVANPNNFTNTAGWIGAIDLFGVYPKFGIDTDLSTYQAKSYLRLPAGWTYNAGIQSNVSWFKPTDKEVQDGKLGGIQKGEKYIFRVKAKGNSNDAPADYVPSNRVSANLFKYTNVYAKTGSALFNQVDWKKGSDNWIEYTLISKQSVSVNDIDQYGLFLYSDQGRHWIEDVQFFKYAEGITSYQDGKVQRINPGEISLQSIVTTVYKYYYKNNGVDSADKLTYLYTGTTESDNYKPVYNNYEKVGTITEKESNRFNILQSIAETFQAWVKFRIEHEPNGAIKFIDGVPQKFVSFVEEVGKETGISFEYGIDLNTITRVIDSDKLATKVIVNPNTNEFAKNGFCSIARSNQNYTKENFIINLDYYTQQGLLDKIILDKDLYSTQNGYIGYYYYLHSYNKEYDALTDELLTKKNDLTKQNAQKEVYEQYLLAANQQLGIIQTDLMNLAGVSQWASAQEYAREHASNEKVQSLLNAYSQTQNQIAEYQKCLDDIIHSIDTLQNRIDGIITRQEILIDLIKLKHKEFNDKYAAYLMEGTWQDEDYIDDDKYFLDGLNVAYTSSRPQLSYTINVIRLNFLEEYSSKVFNLGDICYMQDREFFGYLTGGITPYKEKILVSKISSFFDEPWKDVLTVQNYKTRFDDLFQRIAATTQSLSYAEGSFARAAGVINPDGTLSFAALQDTFDYNEDLVLNSSNQDVVWDDTGITVTNKFNSADKTKIIAGGIFVTNDGGQTWKNAVRGDGISTDLLTAGRVNTSEIYIYDGNAPSFRWDSDGITAYSYSGNEINFNKFVRHDKYGIYGYDGVGDFIPSSEDDVWENSRFGLTWKGFFLRSSGEGGALVISTDNDIVITDGNGYKRVQIGRINGSSTNYGLQLRDRDNNIVFSVDGNGANIAGWTMSNESIYKTVSGGTIGLYSNPKTTSIAGIDGKYYITAGSNFGITADGRIVAGSGTIGSWNIDGNRLYAGNESSGSFTEILGAARNGFSGGTLRGGGKTDAGQFGWEIGPNGFIFNGGSEITNPEGKSMCQIVLGPTTINNHYIYTTHISAGGGSIGGCRIDTEGIICGSWKFTSTGIVAYGRSLGLQYITWVTSIIRPGIKNNLNPSPLVLNVVNNQVTIPRNTYVQSATIDGGGYVTGSSHIAGTTPTGGRVDW